MDFNDPFYKNGDNLKDENWPCRLKESKIPRFKRNKMNKHLMKKSQFKKTPPIKQNVDLTPNRVKLTHTLKTHRNSKTVNRKELSIEQLSK